MLLWVFEQPSGNSVNGYNDRCLARWFNTASQITAMKIFQLACPTHSPWSTNLSFLSAVKSFQSQSLWVVTSHWLTLVGRRRQEQRRAHILQSTTPRYATWLHFPASHHPNAQDSRFVICVCIARHGSCFSVQFVRAQLGTAGTSEATLNTYIQSWQGDTTMFLPQKEATIWDCIGP